MEDYNMRNTDDFKERFRRWKNGENYWAIRNETENGNVPEYANGKSSTLSEAFATIRKKIQENKKKLAQRSKANQYTSQKLANPGSAAQAMQYFMDKGFTDYQAAGLVGNFMRESGLVPNIVNKSSGAYGLAQWLGPRKQELFARYGSNPTFEQELDFIWHELNSPTYKNAMKHLKAARDPQQAARAVMGYYEFLAGPEGAIAAMNKHNQNGELSMRRGIENAYKLLGQKMPLPQLSPSISAKEFVIPAFEKDVLRNGYAYGPVQLPEVVVNNKSAAQQIDEARRENVLNETTRWNGLPNPIAFFNSFWGEDLPTRQTLNKPIWTVQ